MKIDIPFKFILIKSKNQIKDKVMSILEVLDEALDIISYNYENQELIIFFTASIMDISDLTNLLIEELYLDCYLYESVYFKAQKEANIIIELIKSLFEKYTFNNYYLNNKIIIKQFLKSNDELIKKIVLNKYYNDKTIIKTIKVFLENNQNIKEASKKLYIHRNTLNLRISKFEEVTSFNLKQFIDAHYIYQLLTN